MPEIREDQLDPVFFKKHSNIHGSLLVSYDDAVIDTGMYFEAVRSVLVKLPNRRVQVTEGRTVNAQGQEIDAPAYRG